MPNPVPPRDHIPGLLRALGFGGAVVLTGAASPKPAVVATPVPVAVRAVIDAAHGPVNRFRPDEAFGAALDGAGQGDTDRLYTPHNVAAMTSAGLQRISYRLRTELGIEAWHWNPEGAWSDPDHTQGYWTSSDKPGAPIMTSWGYNLPRRGDTVDNANNASYSRLDDGDPETFWKSNPYLDPRYTHQPARPQWAIIELEAPTDIDTARISWADPYAVRYQVQYWVGRDEYDRAGRWVAFPGGTIAKGAGGEATLKLASSPIRAHFLRLWLETSSGGAGATPAEGGDIRDHLGYAVREVAFGTTDAQGVFHDVVRHGRKRGEQTPTHVSSTDPWHRAVDRDKELEQPGLDRVYLSGLTNGLPMMAPAAIYYDTPENAAAELRYLRARGYPLTQMELGEEPDGQYIDAADYGALYIETYDILHAIDPGLSLGGPSLQSGVTDTWLDPNPDHSWNGQFITYLKARGRLDALGFFSFERYPFDDMCGDVGAKLRQQTVMEHAEMARLRAEGVPTNIPWIISEYGFSAFSGRPMVELPGALLDADLVADFLTEGGDAAYMFGYGPNIPVNQHLECAGYGNMMLQLADPEGQATVPLPAYHFARLLTGAWTAPGHGEHQVFKVGVTAAEPAPEGGPAVTAYAVRRPDGRWAVMAVNRDEARPANFTLRVKGASGAAGRLRGPLEVVQYSSANYAWTPDGYKGHPSRNLPPTRSAPPGTAAPIVLPPWSLTVIRETGPQE
jgi:hypothetical protein